MRSTQPRALRPWAPSILALAGVACVASDVEPEVGQEPDPLLETIAEAEPATPVDPADEEFDEDAYLEALEAEYAELEEEALPEQEPAVSPYVEFGRRIVVYESGFIAKPYYFPAGMGQRVFDLLGAHAGIDVHHSFEGVPEEELELGPQPDDAVVLNLLPGFDQASFAAPRSESLAQPQSVELSDLLMVTARPPVLRRVEGFLESFIADVRQIEVEAKIVEVTSRRTFDYGIRPIDSSTPIFGLPGAGTLVNGIDFSFRNTVDTSEGVFQVASVFDGVEFNALLEMVSTREDVSIVSRPKVAVREGARADVRTARKIPFFHVTNINANGNFTTNLDFEDVGVQMYVIPRVVGRDTVILDIDIEASQQTGTAIALTQGAGDNTSVVTVPEISSRRTTTTVRLEPGQAVILGGLTTESTQEREKKIPGLGDVPLLGYLFKSRFTETVQTNVLFFIRPRILQGMDLSSEGF